MPRASAQRKYKRSKSSFIRDVELAFARSDDGFLKHFRVGLNDGTELEGIDATKAALRKLNSKQPRWYIEVSFLETRYWLAPDAQETIERTAESNDLRSEVNSSNTTVEMRHQLDLAQQQIDTQDKTIHRLESDKVFLQDELENRRGEIDKLRGFFESVGDAADSTAKLRSGTQSDGDVIEATQTLTSIPKEGSIVRQYLPTFHKYLSKLRSV